MRKKHLLALAVVVIPLLIASYIIHSQSVRINAQPRIIISKETTYLLGPLDQDGYVDYVAAINQAASKDVIPENNAVVLLWQTLGPADVPLSIRDRYFKLLGIHTLPENGDYYRLRTASVEIQRQAAIDGRWEPAQYPELVAWLAANDKFIQRFVECSRRPHFYSPFVGRDRPKIMNALLPAAQSSRELGRALVTRAMLRIQQRSIDAAFQDSLACHRLGRLVGQGPTLVEALVAITLDQVADNVDQSIAETGGISAAQARSFSAELRKLPSLPDIAAKVNWGDRLLLLDTIDAIAQDRELVGGFGAKNGTLSDEINRRMANAEIDLNQALRNTNLWHNRVAAIAAEPPGITRRRDLDAFDRDIHALGERLAAAEDAGGLDSMSGEGLSHYYADKLVAVLFPAVDGALRAKDIAAQRFDLTCLAYAHAGYLADHRRYPSKLSDLATEYVAAIPRDIFSDQELHYVSSDRGYLLYSVGPNGIDDGGREPDSDPPGDDIAVRVPRKPPDNSGQMP